MLCSYTTDQLLQDGLRSTDTENTRAVLCDASLYSSLLTIINETLSLATTDLMKMGLAASGKAVAVAKLGAKATNSSNVEIGMTAAQIILVTAKLITRTGSTPGMAAVAIGAAFAKKTSLAFGLVGKSDKQAKCIAALSDVAAATLTTAYLAPTAATGIGGVALAINLSQVVLAGIQAYDACVAVQSDQ